MCEICKSMLAAEHKKQKGAPKCPRCHRFPLAAQTDFDPAQFDYVEPDIGVSAFTIGTRPKPGPTAFPGDLSPFQLEQAGEEIPVMVTISKQGHAQGDTCYHCYQVESELAQQCPVCGDSYLPPELRKPGHA